MWNFPGAYSLEFDIAEREEWYSQNTSAVLPIAKPTFVPAQHSRYDAQKPKFSVRWQPLDPKVDGIADLARQLQRSVPCTDITRSYTSRGQKASARLARPLADSFTIHGIDS